MAPSSLALNFLRSSISASNGAFATRHPLCSAVRQQSLLTRASSRVASPSAQWTFKDVSKTRRSQNRGYKTVQEARSKYKMGPLSPISVILFLGSGVGLYYYFQYERERMERVRIAEHSKGIGKPKVGGPFDLIDQDGKPWGSEKMKGKYSLVYFGFSHCPDICPEELDKMSEMLSIVEDALPSSSPQNPDLLPVFITCDPARDTPAVLKAYLKEFDSRLIGLTGTWEQIKSVCKAYRVYFSTPAGVKPGMDYLVDHSIYFYLMDPDGDFVEAIGRQHTPDAAAKLITGHMKDWKGPLVKD